MSDTFHKALAVLGTLAAIVLPIVAHSVYGSNPHTAQAVAFGMTVLGVLGFTAVKPLFPGDVTAWVKSHKAFTLVGTAAVSVLPMLAESGSHSPSLKLGIEIASAVLMALGFTTARPLGMESRASALLPVLFFGAIASGCAQYSACVKQQTTPAVKAVTLMTVEQQAIALVNLAVSQEWLQVGITGLDDACTDTNCKALLMCVLVAWQETHPASTAKAQVAHAAINAYKAQHADAAHRAMIECGHAVAVLELPPVCHPVADATDPHGECREIRLTGPSVEIQ